MNFRGLFSVLALAISLLATGCAHKITINPVAEPAKASATKIDKKVGLYISEADRLLAVETPGGGGDNLSYTPYKDLESPLFFKLSSIYSKVESLPALDGTSLANKNLNLILAPKLSTTSSSASAFTWPPTDFSVTIKAKAMDGAGKLLWEESVVGSGKAEFDEFKADFPLAARRASKDALDKLEVLLRKKEGQ